MGWSTVLRFALNFLFSLSLILGYVCIGAVVFVKLERQTEVDNKSQAIQLLQVGYWKIYWYTKYNQYTNDGCRRWLPTIVRIRGVSGSAGLIIFTYNFYLVTTTTPRSSRPGTT